MHGIDSQLVQNILIAIALFGGIFVYSKSHVPQQTIKNLQALVNSYKEQVEELREKQLVNFKAIAALEGQIKVYKELPLQEISTSLRELSNSNKQILTQLQTDAKKLVKGS